MYKACFPVQTINLKRQGFNKSINVNKNRIIRRRIPTGRIPRWYVLPRRSRTSRSSSCLGVNPFIVPCVPTGMNTGVSTAACGRLNTAVRALVVEHLARISNFKAHDGSSAMMACGMNCGPKVHCRGTEHQSLLSLLFLASSIFHIYSPQPTGYEEFKFFGWTLSPEFCVQVSRPAPFSRKLFGTFRHYSERPRKWFGTREKFRRRSRVGWIWVSSPVRVPFCFVASHSAAYFSYEWMWNPAGSNRIKARRVIRIYETTLRFILSRQSTLVSGWVNKSKMADEGGPSSAESSCLSYNTKKLVCIDYPGYVKNVSRVMETLGGEDNVSRTFANSSLRMEMTYRPNDPHSKVLCGDRSNTSNLLLRVKRRRRRNVGEAAEPGEWKYEQEVLGIVDTTYRWTNQ